MKKSLLFNTLIFFSLFLEFILNDFSNHNVFVIISFLAIGLLNIFSIVNSKKPFSFFNMFHYFSFFFFYYIGLKQYLNDTIVWRFITNLAINDFDFLITNFVIIVFETLFIISYFIFSPKSKRKSIRTNLYISNNALFFATIVNFLILAFFISQYGFFGILARSSTSYSSNQTATLIVEKFIRMIPFASVLIVLNKNGQKDALHYALTAINSIIVFILIFPLGGVPRYCVAAVYIALACKFFVPKVHNSAFVFLILMIGIMYVFPSINFLRYNLFNDLDQFKFVGYNYASGDFDCYQVTLSVIKHVNINGPIFGQNILTAFLFFVPRSIWGGKMLGSGWYLSTFYFADFNNISCSFIAESYYSFGLFGLMIGALGLAWLAKKIDFEIYDSNQFNGDSRSIAFVLIGYSFFLLRGDLLSSFAYLVATILAFYTAKLFLLVFSTKKLVLYKELN